jgi:hypothetical protein
MVGVTAPAFESATIILPVVNETESLRKTVEVIEQSSAADVRDYLFVVCQRTTQESLKLCESFQATDPHRYVVHLQTLPFLGGAMREAFDRARGSHTIMMASDLETDPATVRVLITEAKEFPDAVITASRWLAGGGFDGYSRVKLVSNFVFQKLFSLLYGVRLTDMTYGYRIFPTPLLKSIAWEEVRHPFLFETILKPLRLGVRVREVASPWKARIEGESQNSFFRNFAYLAIGLKVRFYPRKRILRSCEP